MSRSPQTPDDDDGPWLTTDQAAALVPYSARTLAKLRGLGQGPAFYRMGRRPIYREADVRQWLRDQIRQGMVPAEAEATPQADSKARAAARTAAQQARARAQAIREKKPTRTQSDRQDQP